MGCSLPSDYKPLGEVGVEWSWEAQSPLLRGAQLPCSLTGPRGPDRWLFTWLHGVGFLGDPDTDPDRKSSSSLTFPGHQAKAEGRAAWKQGLEVLPREGRCWAFWFNADLAVLGQRVT